MKGRGKTTLFWFDVWNWEHEHGFGRVHDAISCPSTSFITADEDAIMSIYTNTGVVKPTKAWSELQFEAVRVWNVLVSGDSGQVRVHVRARTSI